MVSFKAACEKVGCDGEVVARGLCQQHYSRSQYEQRRAKVCSIEGCGKPLWAAGFCHPHWDEKRIHPELPKQRIKLHEMTMPVKMEEIKDVLTSGDVARVCNVAPRTVSKWIDNGLLLGYRIPGSRDRRVAKTDLISFMVKNNMPMHISAKRSVVVYGVCDDNAEIIKKLTEDELGISVTICTDPYTTGVVVGETKPRVIFVDCENISSVLSMLKAMDISTAEIVVATNDDASKLKGLDIDVIPKPYRIKDVINAIARRI
jgi:hypothetical protein